MDGWDWFTIVGYLAVLTAFSVTLYASMTEAGRNRGVASLSAVVVAALWPVTLPVAAIAATIAVMGERHR